MSKTYRAWNPRQSWLLPPSPQAWMPEGDFVYFLMDVVETLDISSITVVYQKNDRGFPPFHPRMMLCLLIYSYAMAVRSSRQIAQRCQRDVGWRVIVGEDIPDFRTISGFRKMHLPAFSALFLEVLGLGQAAAQVALGKSAAARWTRMSACADYVDFKKVFGVGEGTIHYAVTYLFTARPNRVRLRYGMDYYARMWRNGKLVLPFARGHGSARKGHFSLEVDLPAGQSELLVKVAAGSAGNGFWMAVSDLADLIVGPSPDVGRASG